MLKLSNFMRRTSPAPSGSDPKRGQYSVVGAERDLAGDDPGHSYAMYYMRKSITLFMFGWVVYLCSWMPILCRIFRGVVKYPDQMPVPIWITTIGILLFYETFIMAQCTAMLTRFKFIFDAQLRRTSRPDSESESTLDGDRPSELYRLAHGEGRPAVARMSFVDRTLLYVIASGAQADWVSIALFAVGSTADLIAAVVLTVESLRTEFGIPTGQHKQEVWLLTAYLFATWSLVLLVSDALERARGKTLLRLIRSYTNSGEHRKNVVMAFLFAVIYLGIGVAMFFLWAKVIMPSVESFSYSVAIGLAIGAAVLTLFIFIYQSSTKLASNPISASEADDEDGDDASVLATHAAWHWWASVFHACLVVFALTIGMANTDIDWQSDYLLYNRELYLMTGNWKATIDKVDAYEDLVKTNASETTLAEALSMIPKYNDKYRVDYCATGNGIAVYFIMVSVFWSCCSLLQHWFSYKKLDLGNSDNNKPPTLGPLDRNTTYAAIVLLLGVVTPLTLVGFRGWLIALLPAFVLVTGIVLWVTIFGPECYYRGGNSWPRNQQVMAHELVHQTRLYKWIEYTFSATAMHVVVLQIAGILSAHEIFLSAAMLATAMMITHQIDAELFLAEQGCLTSEMMTLSASKINRSASRINLQQVCDTEKPFLFLSFFAKGILTVALTVPFVFVDKSDYQLAPATCLE